MEGGEGNRRTEEGGVGGWQDPALDPGTVDHLVECEHGDSNEHCYIHIILDHLRYCDLYPSGASEGSGLGEGGGIGTGPLSSQAPPTAAAPIA